MKYKNKLELWGSTWVENELGEKTKEFIKIKDVYCKIIPGHGNKFGNAKKVGNTELMESSNVQTILVRKLSIKEPKIDMYFKNSIGNKFEISDFFPNYKNNDEWEFLTKINYE